MKAMVLNKICKLPEERYPLNLVELPAPAPAEGCILVKVAACGVCHTELDEIEGRTPPPVLPVIPGHQIIGHIEALGKGAHKFAVGDRVGISWIHSACGKCSFCSAGHENLCEDFKATGRDAHGGYAEYTSVSEDFVFSIPDIFADAEAAPLLCAGSVGYRSLRLTGIQNGQNLGLVGFGASAHIVLQTVRYKYPDSKIFVVSRTQSERDFAMELGAHWAGDFDEELPEKMHCAIDTTPVWKPVVDTMKNLERGGRLIINAIRKEPQDKEHLLSIDYSRDLWMEKEIKSVANVARTDVAGFLEIAAHIPIKPEVQEYAMEEANVALVELKQRKIRGAKVLRMG